MNNKPNNKLLLDFFSKNLSVEQKQEFLEKASSDPDFLKEFIKTVELEEAYEELFGSDKIKEEENGKDTEK